ncbi:hypothetical protein [Quisquiliibacterium transsilvanicum]|uniref:DUF2946 domain-containing protein n=1 Tax=Quisquiliibacterium transsilvanicum TaxID=1549638 RepID=A0A7W8HFS5_9BURK|nr:hypothetical protein [Quisquiliibacterium transsilvanicum]MBB5271216.1 hypothetical protein [Quisquiliibacterium transsilvanicum]
MRSLLRSLFVWLMALALPLQGIAAVGMQACGPVHERAGQVAAAAHDAGHMHAHADAEHVTAGQESPAAGHQCGACAACCTAAALPSAVVFAAASGAAAELIPAAPERVASFVPPGLERPPRAILA